MSLLTLSPDFHLVIPPELREQFGLRAGQAMQAIALEDRIELIPVQPMRVMRGFLRGIDTSIERDGDRV